MCTRRSGSGRYPRRCRDAVAWSFDRDVDQRTPSTPEVRLPLFSVTHFTARTLPLNEQVSSRCKALTLPQRLASDALTIRACSRFTWRSHCFQSIWSQSVTPAEDAHTGYPAFICVFLIRRFCLFSRQSRPAGSPPALAGKLACFLSVPLQDGFGLFQHPQPVALSAPLTRHFPQLAGRTTGLPCFDSTTGLI